MTAEIIQFLPFKLARRIEAEASEINHHREALAQAMTDKLGEDLAYIALEGGPVHFGGPLSEMSGPSVNPFEPFTPDYPSDYGPGGAA